jgi:hypothetical protein
MRAMRVFVGTTIGMCALIITWAIGLNPDVGGLIALACVGIGLLAEMVGRSAANRRT